MKAAHGYVRQVRKIMSQGVVVVEVQIPAEAYKDSVLLLDDQDVLVTRAPLGQWPYGVLDTDGPVPEVPEPDTDTLASRMHKDGYFNNPSLWKAMEAAGVYTQAMHKAWIETLPCCADGAFTEHRMRHSHLYPRCGGQIVGHHVRTAANAGTGIKPPHWFMLPLCCAHHDWWHKHIDRAVTIKMSEMAVKMTAGKMKEHAKEYMGRASLSGITVEQLAKFEEAIEFESHVLRRERAA